MKKFWLGFVLVVVSMAVSCTHYIYISRSMWQPKLVVADGKANEWKLPLKYYDEKSKLQFSVSNDLKNIYFCVRATEQETQTKMINAGFQLWIDTTGKNEHSIGVQFPMANTNIKTTPTEQVPHQKGRPKDITALKNKFINGYREMELSGFKTGINGTSPLNSKWGIAASVNWDSAEIMTYEAIVPFNTFYKDSITPKDSLKLMGVSFVLNGLPIPEIKHEEGGGGGGNRGGGGMHGGGGGMHGGGEGRGGGGSSGTRTYQGSNYLYEKNTITKIIQLCGAKEKPTTIEYFK